MTSTVLIRPHILPNHYANDRAVLD